MPTAHSRDKICILSPQWSRQRLQSIPLQCNGCVKPTTLQQRQDLHPFTSVVQAMLAIYSLALQWMCQAHHSVVETRSASRDLDKLPTFACSMYNWSFHLKSISSQTSSLHQSLMFPYTHALLYSKNIYPHLLTKFQVSKVTANLTEVCGEFDHVW